jgi:hypothetical protein
MRLATHARKMQRALATAYGALEQFVNEKNLAHFRRRLAETTDHTERQMIWKLLAEEKAKERVINHQSR